MRMRRLGPVSALAASALAVASLFAGGVARAQQPADDAIIHALLEGMENQVEALIARKANVNAVDDAGVTALGLAVSGGNLQIVQRLLRAGANPNLPDSNGVTPLFVAIENGSMPLVRQLLDSGANPNVSRLGGETPLMVAVRSGSAEAVRMLLEKKAKVNKAEEEFGQTALMMSAGKPEIMRMLLAGFSPENSAGTPCGRAVLLAYASRVLKTRGPAPRTGNRREELARRNRFPAF